MLVTFLNSTWNHAPIMLFGIQAPLLFSRACFAGPHVSAQLSVKAESEMMERFCSPSGELHSTEHQQQKINLT